MLTASVMGRWPVAAARAAARAAAPDTPFPCSYYTIPNDFMEQTKGGDKQCVT